MRFTVEQLNLPTANKKLVEAINKSLGKSNPYKKEAERAKIKESGKSKYRNVKTSVDSFVFDSKKEAAYYEQLKMRNKAGEVDSITLQPKFPIVINDKKICSVILDFSYRNTLTGRVHFIDTKGFQTAVSKLKKKLVEALYQIEVEWV